LLKKCQMRITSNNVRRQAYSDSNSYLLVLKKKQSSSLRCIFLCNHFVRRRFGLWKPGNPQSLASQRSSRPRARFLSDVRRGHLHRLRPPWTLTEDKRRAPPRRATTKRAASTTKTRTNASAPTREPASEPLPLIKARKAGATHTNSPRIFADYKRDLLSGRILC